MIVLAEILKKYINLGKKWSIGHILGIFIFNTVFMLEILLYSAGYFSPYFPITINLIFFSSLILSIILLGLRSKVIFIIALFFWLFTALLELLGVKVWAERTAIYSYQALLVGTLLLIIEIRFTKFKSKS